MTRGHRADAVTSFVLAGIMTTVTIILMILVRAHLTPASFVVLGAGLVYSTWLFRWGTRSVRVNVILTFLMLVGFIVLSFPSVSHGLTPFAWFAGCLIGGNLGAGWRALARPEDR